MIKTIATEETEVNRALGIFRKYCNQRKMRYTPEREIIIKEIYRSKDHFNVDNLFERVRANNPASKIAKTSVYRSVPHFLDAGLLRQSAVQAGEVIYERTLGHLDHDHFVCLGCGKIIEFSSPELTSVQQKLCRENKFTVLWRTNVVNGYCQDCQDKNGIKDN